MQHGMARHQKYHSLSWGHLWDGRSGKLQGTRRFAHVIWVKGSCKVTKLCVQTDLSNPD